MVLVSILVAVGQGNDGEGVDRFHQCTLCKCFRYHLTAVVWHRIPDGEKGQILIKASVNSYNLNLIHKADARNKTAYSKFMSSFCKSNVPTLSSTSVPISSITWTPRLQLQPSKHLGHSMAA